MAKHLALEHYIPAIKDQGGIYTLLPVTLPALTTIGGSSVSALGTISSDTAAAFSVGLNGATNPAFNVDSSTALQADGINVAGLAAGDGAAVSVITSGTNAPLTIDAAGSGTVTIAGTSTGAITLGTAATVTAGDVTLTDGDLILTANGSLVSFTGTGTNGGVLKNLYNDTASALSGTQKDIKIVIGSTPYYFTVYPTKA